MIQATYSVPVINVADSRGPKPLSSQNVPHKFNIDKYQLDVVCFSDINISPQPLSAQNQIYQYNNFDYVKLSTGTSSTSGALSAFDPYITTQGDLLFNSVDLLLHFNSTIDDDKSNTNHTVIAQGDASIDTTVKKWGAGSLSLDGVNDYVSIADSPDWDFGTGNFTIEFWFRLKDQDGYNWLLNRNSTISSTYHYRKWVIIASGTTVQFYGAGSSIMNGGPSITGGSGTTSIGTWHHVALVRNSNTTSLYLDGVSQGSVSDYQNHSYADGIQIGAGQDQWANAYIDDLRITSAARYTGNFSVPTGAFGDQIADKAARPFAEGMVLTPNASGATFNPVSGSIHEKYGQTYSQWVSAMSTTAGTGISAVIDLPAASSSNWVTPGRTGYTPISAVTTAKVEVTKTKRVQYNRFSSVQISENTITTTKDLPNGFIMGSDNLSVEGNVTFKTDVTFTAESDSEIITVTLKPYFYVIRN